MPAGQKAASASLHKLFAKKVALNTIKKRADFLLATANGKRFVAGTFILQMLTRAQGHPAGVNPRFGYTVTKKMGNAVIRNRIKRRLREAVRLSGQNHALIGNDYVLIPRHKAKDCAFDVLLRDMEFAFSKIPTMKDDTSTVRKKKP